MFNPKKSKKDPKVLKCQMLEVWRWSGHGRFQDQRSSAICFMQSAEICFAGNTASGRSDSTDGGAAVQLCIFGDLWRYLEFRRWNNWTHLIWLTTSYDSLIYDSHDDMMKSFDDIDQVQKSSPGHLISPPCHIMSLSVKSRSPGDETADSGGFQRSACQCLGVSRLQPVIFHDIPWPSMKLPCWKTCNRIAMSSRV